MLVVVCRLEVGKTNEERHRSVRLACAPAVLCTELLFFHHCIDPFQLQLTAAMPVKPRAASKDSGSSGGGIGGEPNKWLSPRILTLQKSISTPSILAVKDGSTVAGLNNKSPALLTTTGGPASVLTRMTSGPKEAPSGPSVAGPTS